MYQILKTNNFAEFIKSVSSAGKNNSLKNCGNFVTKESLPMPVTRIEGGKLLFEKRW